MYLAVAPATSAYRACLKTHSADSGECRTILRRDWATYSGDRFSYAALVGLAPIPVGWLAGWFFVRQLRMRPRDKSRAWIWWRSHRPSAPVEADRSSLHYVPSLGGEVLLKGPLGNDARSTVREDRGGYHLASIGIGVAQFNVGSESFGVVVRVDKAEWYLSPHSESPGRGVEALQVGRTALPAKAIGGV